MLGLIVTGVLGGLIIYFINMYVKRSQSYWKEKGVPFLPPGSILFGNMSDVVLRKASMGENLIKIYRELDGQKFGGYFQFQTPVLMIRDPELINYFLIKDFGHFHDRNMPTSEDFDLMGSSLASLTGQRWRSLRYKMTPTFTSGKLKRMFSQIVSCSDAIIDHVSTLPRGEAVEVRDLMFKFTINVIGSVAFGLQIDSHKAVDGRNKVFIDMSKRFFKPSMIQFLKFFLRMSYPRLMEALGMRMNDPEMNEFFSTLVADIIRLRQAEEKDAKSSNKKRDDFLQLMMDIRKSSKNKDEAAPKSNVKEEQMEAEDHALLDQFKHVPNDGKQAYDIEMTDEIMTSQAFIFIAGGSETTAAVLQFALFEMAHKPEVLAKVHQEIDEFTAGGQFTYEAVRDMKYLENVLNETLRLHPPGSILARFCTESYKIPGTDIVLEKGSQINVPVIGIHLDPKYFPQPEEFIPERFDKEMPKGVFFPFGGGPRICIAMRLAMLQMKIFLARLLMRYSVTLSDKTTVPLKLMSDSIVQHVKGGVWLHFEPRKL
ncbi:cytochrome P450 6B7 [Nilaparvata lugens]|uniref:cytochrome P450 6B7 n=1 Tax=Nilaparvata lugens TaxID=108931 RepID=UPI00193D7072|nr:cytochrome P450 6B7 [Nilaparvata lugens]XP_039282693.1 cytochrome P450 6B7 [Nilaparvata lugens]